MKVTAYVVAALAGVSALATGGCRERRVVVVEERQVMVEQRPGQVIVVEQAPPPVIYEAVPPPPSRIHVWISGYYGWQHGRHVWVPGHYVMPPRPGVHWVPDRWDHDPRGYRYSPGHWR